MRRDPARSGLLLFTGVLVAGFVLIGLAWRLSARTLLVSNQVPALVSGGLTGLALILIGGGLTHVVAGRRLASRERRETDLVLDEAVRLLDALRRIEP